MKRPWLLGIGIALSIGAVFWMRALASWRPVTLGEYEMPGPLRFVRDGRLLVGLYQRQILLNIETGAVDSNFQSRNANNTPAFPRVRFDKTKSWFVFSPARGQNVVLARPAKSDANPIFFTPELVKTAWSKARNEVYGLFDVELLIWNWSNGRLKKRVPCAGVYPEDTLFSPDKKWLLSSWQMGRSLDHLDCYDVQTGQKVGTRPIEHLGHGFSPDSRFIWFIERDKRDYPVAFHLARASDLKPLWSAPCSGPAKWLPDGRIGLVQSNGFSWRDVSGRELRHLRGPFADLDRTSNFVYDWALSPDGNWIYSSQRDETIRRWRAR